VFEVFDAFTRSVAKAGRRRTRRSAPTCMFFEGVNGCGRRVTRETRRVEGVGALRGKDARRYGLVRVRVK